MKLIKFSYTGSDLASEYNDIHELSGIILPMNHTGVDFLWRVFKIPEQSKTKDTQ